MLLDQVRRTIRRYGLLPHDSRVVIALSGGADSVALLCALTDIAESEGFHVIGAAHLNHQLRGADADVDEEFCRSLADTLNIPLHVGRVDVAARARDACFSIEHAAHDSRLEFYERAADVTGASAVAVAHTKSDQAETFLLRLLRGAGPRGLGGMHPRSGIVVRPFIEIARSDVRAFLHAREVAFREDTTNADRTIPRNRIRHELIPFLETHFSPGVVDVLDREAAIAREDAEYLDAAAAAFASRLISSTPAGVEVSVTAVLSHPLAIARRIIRAAQLIAADGRFVGFDAVDAALAFAVSKSAGPLDLPGHRLNRRGDTLVLNRSGGRPAREDPVAFAYPLGVPGNVNVPEAACAISAEINPVPSGRLAADLWTLVGRSDEAVLEAARLTGPLSVRNRRPGDSFRPLGLQGRKKLQDLFVDAKVNRAERDTTPVVVDSQDSIVWVAGHAVAEEFRVTDRTRAVVILRRVSI
jgi:tRNA(Ile)-lysidine synthase